MANDDGKKVWDILGFQYKPLEKAILKDMESCGAHEAIKMYQGLSYIQKISYLDTMAAKIGL